MMNMAAGLQIIQELVCCISQAAPETSSDVFLVVNLCVYQTAGCVMDAKTALVGMFTSYLNTQLQP